MLTKKPRFNLLCRLLCSCATALLLCSVSYADAMQEYAVKSAMVLNFARFTEWPVAALKADAPAINLCVLGDNVVQEAFMQVDEKNVGERTLHVVYLSRLRNVSDCNMLFISGLDKNTSIQLLAEIKAKPILTIGEESLIVDHDGMINLGMQGGKIDIQINLTAVKQAGLTISARVLKLATIVK